MLEQKERRKEEGQFEMKGKERVMKEREEDGKESKKE